MTKAVVHSCSKKKEKECIKSQFLNLFETLNSESSLSVFKKDVGFCLCDRSRFILQANFRLEFQEVIRFGTLLILYSLADFLFLSKMAIFMGHSNSHPTNPPADPK